MVVNNWIAANLIWITLAITIVVLIYFVFTIIQTVIKKRRFVSQLNIILLILGLMFLIFLTYHANEIEGKDWGQIILMLGLVIITALYASSTEKQADASVKMAEEMKRPYLLLRLDLADDELLQWDTYKGNTPPSEFKVIIRNAGSGPAKNLYAALWHTEKTYYIGDRRGYLAPDQEWQATISKLNTGIEEKEGWLPELRKKVKQNYAEIIAVEYEDIHNRNWVSYLYLERHVDIDAFVMEEEQNIVELPK